MFDFTWSDLWSIDGDMIWLAIRETLRMTLLSALFAYLIAIPLGILLVVTKKGGIYQNRPINIILSSVINIMRSVPFILLAIFVIPLTRQIIGTALGSTAMIVPLTIAATPFIARLIENALLELDKGLIEAAKSMGASRLKIIYKLYLPECLPSIVLTMGISTITILGFTAMAGVLGGGGLGQVAFDFGYARFENAVLVACIIILVLITQIIQGLVFITYRLLNKK
ncbi:MAG: ABC transporter permease [Firmicutes bacterium]|nr:ABC transporter permease [Bacillota bacterium]